MNDVQELSRAGQASPDIAALPKKYAITAALFAGAPDALYERHLKFDNIVEPDTATTRERYKAASRAVRDILSDRWLRTNKTYARENPKRVYYVSIEFLIGRSLGNNVMNLLLDPVVGPSFGADGREWWEILHEEPDAGLGNGGLGRLAACFLDSMATMQLPAMGYGLRYEHGIFQQKIRNGWQEERPDNWFNHPDPWEIVRPAESVPVTFGCSFELRAGQLRMIPNSPSTLIGVPYDRPVIGYRRQDGQYAALVERHCRACVRFPAVQRRRLCRFHRGSPQRRVVDPRSLSGRPHAPGTRALGSCRNISSSPVRSPTRFAGFANRIAIGGRCRIRPRSSSTTPIRASPSRNSCAFCSTKRISVGMKPGTSRAQRLPTPTTLCFPRRWSAGRSIGWRLLIPRQLEIIFEINRRLLDDVQARYPGDPGRTARTSLVEEGQTKHIRMANLAIVGSHSTNGVAAIHSELLRKTTVKDLAEAFPERFNNKTNGVTPRRWLRLANPSLAETISGAIGDSWIADLSELRKLRPLTTDAAFCAEVQKAKRAAKARFADWVKRHTDITVDPDTIFDCQIKRIHEYKRQLLNALRIVVLYQRLRDNPGLDIAPRTFFFAGKAAPAYYLAKVIIKFINNLAQTIDADPAMRGKLKVVFLPEYNVTLAERCIPAADVSNQISTAGYEASGTSNMKFMMNGALTIGTRDGATIEMAEEAGEENVFLFGLTAQEVADSRPWYSPYWHYQNEPETRSALDLIFSDHFSQNEPGIFEPLRGALLTYGDQFMHLADLTSYLQADGKLCDLYRKPGEWTQKVILNIAASGKFSSDRTIREYARDIWGAKPCPVA